MTGSARSHPRQRPPREPGIASPPLIIPPPGRSGGHSLRNPLRPTRQTRARMWWWRWWQLRRACHAVGTNHAAGRASVTGGTALPELDQVLLYVSEGGAG